MSLEIEGRVKPSRSRASVNTQITLVEDVRRELPEVGGGQVEMGSCCLMAIKFQFCKMKMS